MYATVTFGTKELTKNHLKNAAVYYKATTTFSNKLTSGNSNTQISIDWN
jgi:hypothetical protein